MNYSFISQGGTTAVSALRSGEIDWTDAIPAQQLSILSRDDTLEVGTVVANDYWYITMNFDAKPFADTRVRQAVAYAIDRRSIAQVVGYGTATPNELAIPSTSPWFAAYDRYTAGLDRAQTVDKAKGLLRQAGIRSMDMRLMVTTEYPPETVTAAQVIASNLEDIGVTVKIEQLDFGAWLDRQAAGDFDACCSAGSATSIPTTSTTHSIIRRARRTRRSIRTLRWTHCSTGGDVPSSTSQPARLSTRTPPAG